MSSNFKYIDDLETLKALDIGEVMLATGLWDIRQGRYKHLTHKKKVKPTTNVFGNNTCTCSDCGFHASSAVDVAKYYKGGDFVEGLRWISEAFNVKKMPNPDYIPSENERQDWEKEKKSFSQKVSVPVVEMSQEKFEMSYKKFNAQATKESDTDKGYDMYATLPYKARLMLIYTDIYLFSLKQEQGAKLDYFKNREIDPSREDIKRLGYIPVEKFEELKSYLSGKYLLEDLVEVRVLNDAEHTKPYCFKLHYIKNGGVVVYPSFHVYQTNLVTGFMFRPTHPEKWMVESHLKEIQMSANDIYNTLPYGFTNAFIQAKAIKCVVEGGPDSHCAPEEINGHKVIFISSPGAGNLKEDQLGYLSGQTLRFMLDPDEAGQKGVYGYISIKKDLFEEKTFLRNREGLIAANKYKEELKTSGVQFYESIHDGELHKCARAGVNAEVCTWNKEWGDLNNVRKHIAKKIIPIETMEEFLIKHVKVKKISVM
ncbi:MAG: hypothetical protein PHI38_07075 [Sulfurimonas sp.]|uniref:hypothetical protein n=1 Tax=Sulfurimonas sp. TaxID=2022749 RepID=UPI00263262F4|nr:hypothetical protein [Sulfurimonas sp.]MDD3476615.1 hypothetical protein [Sulfurimonas sp.]